MTIEYADIDVPALSYRAALKTFWRVYHCWNADGELLYIGQTQDWYYRRSVHMCRSRWWPEVADVTFSDYLSPSDALAVEAACIRWEKPRHNIRHNAPEVAAVERAARKAIRIARTELERWATQRTPK